MRRFHPGRVPIPLRLALVSFLINLAMEASVVFMPLYARSVGSSNLDIGLMGSTYGVAFFLSSLLFGRQSDIHGRVRFIRAGLGFSAIAYLGQIASRTPVALLAVRGSIGLCLGVTSAAIMAYSYENQKQIGNFVSYGSLGWVFGAATAAIVRDYQPLFVVSAVSSVLAFLVSLTFREQPINRLKLAFSPLPAIKANLLVYLTFFLRQTGAYAVWTIFPLHLAGIGVSKSLIATLDIINSGGQFIAMRLVERFDPVKMFRTGLAISILVFITYALARNYLLLVPAQMMLAISWSTMFIGALSYLLRKNNEYGTVSGLLYSTINLSASVGPFIGGAVAQMWGFLPVMYLSSGLSLVSFLSSGRLGKVVGVPKERPTAKSISGR